MDWIPICDDEHFVDGISRTPELGEKIEVDECFKLAYGLALQGAGRVGSNPLVGVVAVDKDHKFIAAGAHLRFGEAHAEANLIRAIKSRGLDSRLAEATLYCTLEPCSFHGKTPSCAKAIADLPIGRIVYGQIDPNEKVNGKGLKILREAGITCEQNLAFTQMSAKLIKAFAWNLRSARPFVALKLAMSFDGKVGQEKAERYWVTGERARQHGHWLRHLYEGVLVGADTVIVDNPSLSIRHPGIQSPSPVSKVVLDPTGRAFSSRPLLEQHLVMSCGSEDQIYWVVKNDLDPKLLTTIARQLGKVNGHLLPLKCSKQGLDLEALLQTLYRQGVHSLLLEGGRYVWASFLNQGFAQRLHAFQANRILGGSALNWDSQLQSMSGTQLVDMQISPMASDWLLEADIRYSQEEL